MGKQDEMWVDRKTRKQDEEKVKEGRKRWLQTGRNKDIQKEI